MCYIIQSSMAYFSYTALHHLYTPLKADSDALCCKPFINNSTVDVVFVMFAATHT